MFVDIVPCDDLRLNDTLTHSLDNQPRSITQSLSQPHFEGSVRSPLTLPKIQNAIAGVKTARIEVFFISLERS
jgi:hypothetical protein